MGGLGWGVKEQWRSTSDVLGVRHGERVHQGGQKSLETVAALGNGHGILASLFESSFPRLLFVLGEEQ